MKEEYVITACGKCGKKFGVAATHFDRSTRRSIRFICNACGNSVVAAMTEENAYPARAEKIPSQAPLPPPPSQPIESNQKDVSFPITESLPVRRRFGLTQKFLLFTLAPLLIISFLSISFSINKMIASQKSTMTSTLKIVNGISEQLLRQISTTVARQIRQYLFAHPDLKKQDFNRDIYFKKTVLQNIGETGSVSLFEIGGSEGAWRTWVDPDPKLVSRDLREFERVLKDDFAIFWNIISGVQAGVSSSGYCHWPNEAGRLRERYFVCTPVEGTPYAIATSIYVDEFTLPLKKIESQGQLAALQMRNTNIYIMSGGLILIAVILFSYGRNLTGKINAISQRADRISMGELELEEMQFQSKDEIADLNEAINRMQASILLAFKRMRRRT